MENKAVYRHDSEQEDGTTTENQNPPVKTPFGFESGPKRHVMRQKKRSSPIKRAACADGEVSCRLIRHLDHGASQSVWSRLSKACLLGRFQPRLDRQIVYYPS